jgi:mannose-6-phosphate isomerase-like protein (cupin superfamily)
MALINGTASSEFLAGTHENDTILGAQGDDTVLAGGSDDLVQGNEGDDSLIGNRGDDNIEGGAGNDTLRGGHNEDVLNGGDGNDVLSGDRGLDVLIGGTGQDTFVIARAPGGSGSTEGATVVDFTNEDLIGLGGGLTFDQLNIDQLAGSVFISDRITGQPLVNVQNATVDQITNRIVEVPSIGEYGVGNVDLSGLPANVRIVGFFNLDPQPANYLSSSIYTDYANQRDTAQRFVAFDFLQPDAPNGFTRVGPLPHFHSNEYEAFLAVDGTFVFTEGEQTGPNTGELREVVVPAGTLAYGPLGRVHGFRLIEGTGPGRIFSFTLPAGLDNFFVNSGDQVTNRYAQIPPINQEEIARTAFWAAQRGDRLFIPNPEDPTMSIDGLPVPLFPADWPDFVTSGIDDPSRDTYIGPFGEVRQSMVTTEETGALTGQFAWKGTGTPGAQVISGTGGGIIPDNFVPGGTMDYSSVTLDPGTDFAPFFTDTRDGFNVLYTLDGNLSLQFENGKIVEIPPLTYVQIDNGVGYSVGNFGPIDARYVAIDVFNAPVPGIDENPFRSSFLDNFTISQGVGNFFA